MTMMQLQESEEEKKEEGEGAEKKDDSIVYADLDKSAMSEGNIHMIKSNQSYLLIWALRYWWTVCYIVIDLAIFSP